MNYITSENILLIGSVLLFVSILAGKTGYRFGVPVLLLFLFVGMLFGSDGLGLQFSNMESAQFIGMVALTIILFSGGMDTRFADVRPVVGPGAVLSTVGVLLTTVFTGLRYHHRREWRNTFGRRTPAHIHCESTLERCASDTARRGHSQCRCRE